MSEKCLECWEILAYYILDEASTYGPEDAIEKLKEIYVLILEGKKEKIRALFEASS